ncbi:hypothetical protein KCG44_02270 [Pacificimonas sp. WHA3]|uniref:GAF domain-containing protein n=1 Tax=Pacificimonas pallii TaxID=2827236 RepID=A0ABS6SBA8_9SPHN|nr:hypothetical protein [Pacificimonas pallii]MBV7255606.1 hypothetical protein [Pacificimonas pallii]
MNVIDFDSGAKRILDERSAALAGRQEALSHYAAGASAASEAVQDAVLSLMAANGLPEIIRTVTFEWPVELGVDMVALALAAHDEGFRAGPGGIQRLPARRVRAWYEGSGGATVIRSVQDGTSMFGDAGEGVKTIGLAPLTLVAPLGYGVLALGARTHCAPEAMEGTQFLDFLAAALSRKIGTCLMRRP